MNVWQVIGVCAATTIGLVAAAAFALSSAVSTPAFAHGFGGAHGGGGAFKGRHGGRMCERLKDDHLELGSLIVRHKLKLDDAQSAQLDRVIAQLEEARPQFVALCEQHQAAVAQAADSDELDVAIHLDSAEAFMTTALDTFKATRPELEALYDSLDEAQKAHIREHLGKHRHGGRRGGHGRHG